MAMSSKPVILPILYTEQQMAVFRERLNDASFRERRPITAELYKILLEQYDAGNFIRCVDGIYFCEPNS